MDKYAGTLEKLRDAILALAWRVHLKAGATLTEYTFIAAIISIAGILFLIGIGKRVNEMLEMTNNNMPK
jgi:Flp pilus assembly pilin Flp